MTARSRSRRRNPAVAAEPVGIGSAGARDPLAREVKLLGALLGQVLVEQGGPDLLDHVERIRGLTIALRRAGPSERAGLAAALAGVLDALDLDETEAVIRAFALYFHLVDLAETRARIRTLQRRERGSPRGILDDSMADALLRIRDAGVGSNEVEALVARLCVGPVLTAHPTEARRRTLLVGLRRIARLVDRLDDPRLTRDEDADIRRRLREEITILWRTAELRTIRPSALDEVRTAMVAFDETLFTVTPRLYRALDAALDLVWPMGPGDAPTARDSGRTGTRPARVPAILEWGSWIGGDRDGNPAVDAATTVRTMAIHADHLLRGYEAVTTRLMQTISAVLPADRVPTKLAARLAADDADLAEAARSLRARFVDEPYRIRLGAIAERLRRTRAGLTDTVAPLSGRYRGPGELATELDELAEALVADGLHRVAHGEVRALRWQVETFGFHLASLEVRQHSGVHEAALAVLAAVDGGRADPATLVEDLPGAPGVSTVEVVATFRAIADLQRRFGEAACHRYVISFTRGPSDVLDVLRLAKRAGLATPGAAATAGLRPASPMLDVVPLLESGEALERAGPILAELLDDPAYRAHLASRADRQVVMLGYSDSNKELGYLAANRALDRAQRELVEVARSRDVELTLFHGRGGAIGRGGGPANRAILAAPPGAVDGRFRLTEQGEVVAKRYLDPAVARRHLEQLVGAVLLASVGVDGPPAADVASRGGPVVDDLADRAATAYRALVWDDPGFAGFFGRITPIDELAGLRLGSRPAARGRAAGSAAADVAALRAIPWTFAWTQARIELPGWYGIGSAIEGYVAEHGSSGLARLRSLHAEWPFFAGVVDNAELSLARVDRAAAARFAELADAPGDAERWARIVAELERTERWVRELTGHVRPLDGKPAIQRSIALRSPYVDPLSELQVRLLARLRATPAGDPERERLRRLVQLTVNGVAAGLHATG